MEKANEQIHHRSADKPALPAQWFYRLLRALPGVPGFLATVVRRSSRRIYPQHRGDRTTRLDRMRSRQSSSTQAHPSHPAPRLVTIGRNALLQEAGWRGDTLISDFRKWNLWAEKARMLETP